MRFLVSGIILFLLFVSQSNPDISRAAGDLQVIFIDVGQGDSALLRDPNGFDVLIDGGPVSAGPLVAAFLRAQVVDDVDVLVASHADADHIGGLIAVLQMDDIPVESVVYNGYAGTTQTWTSFLAAVSAEGLTPVAAQFPLETTWGDMSVYVLNPPQGLTNPDTNDASLVLRIDYGDVSLLFTGDIDSVVEAQVIARATPVAADILKVAHHGSRYGSSSLFLTAVDPADSVISVGADNQYGHPAPETLLRLTEAGSAVWRTDRNGEIVIASTGMGYTLTVERLWYSLNLPLISR